MQSLTAVSLLRNEALFLNYIFNDTMLHILTVISNSTSSGTHTFERMVECLQHPEEADSFIMQRILLP